MSQPERKGAGRPTNDPDSADTWLQVRVTRRRKAAYVRASKPVKLSAWVTRVLDEASGYDPLRGK